MRSGPAIWRRRLRATSVGSAYTGPDRRRKDSSPAEFPRRDISHNKKFVVVAQKVFGATYFSRSPCVRWSSATSSPRPGSGGPSTARSKECVHTVRGRPSRHRAFDPACRVCGPCVVSGDPCAPLDGRRSDGRVHASRMLWRHEPAYSGTYHDSTSARAYSAPRVTHARPRAPRLGRLRSVAASRCLIVASFGLTYKGSPRSRASLNFVLSSRDYAFTATELARVLSSASLITFFLFASSSPISWPCFCLIFISIDFHLVPMHMNPLRQFRFVKLTDILLQCCFQTAQSRKSYRATPAFTMAGEQQQFFLKWNDFQSNMVSSFKHLRDEKSFTDVTLACDGQTCKAHKMVLSACSPYFKSLLEVRVDDSHYCLILLLINGLCN